MELSGKKKTDEKKDVEEQPGIGFDRGGLWSPAKMPVEDDNEEGWRLDPADDDNPRLD